MGPSVLLDKSPFQKCPKALLPELFRHYSLTVPPILLKEILEDHAEKPGQFMALANRLKFIDVHINLGYRQMLEGDLLGHTVPMTGQPCVTAKGITTAEGLLHVLAEPPEADAVRRWQTGGISPDEKETALRWHHASEGFDMEGFKTNLRRVADGLPKFRGEKNEAVREIARFVDNLLAVRDQDQFLELALAEFSEDVRGPVRARWNEAKAPSLRAFAPYAYYCLRVRYIFALALANGHISSHHNSLLDLEYLYYLPFCHIFCSDDKRLHNVMQGVLLRTDQTFLEYSMFEKALKETHFFFSQFSPQGLKKWLETKGHCPPRGSFVTREMYNRHWKVPGNIERNLAKKLPKELIDSVRRKVKAARIHLGDRAPHRLTIIDPTEPAQTAS